MYLCINEHPAWTREDVRLISETVIFIHRKLLPPATKLQQGNVFTSVCDSVHRGVSIQEGSLSEGVSVQGVSVQGGPCPRGVSVQRGGVCPSGGSLSGRSPYGYVRAVRILLECILVNMKRKTVLLGKLTEKIISKVPA